MLEKLNEKAKGFSHVFTPKVIETQLLFYLCDGGSDTTSNSVDGNISFRFTIKYKCMQSALRGMQSKIFQYFFLFSSKISILRTNYHLNFDTTVQNGNDHEASKRVIPIFSTNFISIYCIDKKISKRI